MAKRRGIIPLCRSDFLQDLTIALGRLSLKSVRYHNSKLHFEVRSDIVNEIAYECFSIEARTLAGTLTKLSIREDARCWLYYRNRNLEFEIRAHLIGIPTEEIAELVRATLIDVDSVREYWQSRAIKFDV